MLPLAAVALWWAAASPLDAQDASVDTTNPPSVSSVASTIRIVQPGDTLMTLSREWFATLTAAAEPVTLAQVLIGIHRENPQAFGRDMNELLVGATVRLPDAATLRRTPRREALEEVREKLGIWASSSAVTAPTDASLPSPSPISPAAAPEPVETLEARLARIEAELADKQQQLDVLAAQQARVAPRSAATTEGVSSVDVLTRVRNAADELGLGLLGGVLALALLVILAMAVGVGTLWRRRQRASSDEPPAPVNLLPSIAPTVRADISQEGGARSIGRLLIDSDLPGDALEGDPPPLTDAGSLIDLAQAYLEMGQTDAARVELQRALEIGDEAQRAEAQRLLETLSKT